MLLSALKSMCRVLISLSAALAPVAMAAQTAPPANGMPSSDNASKWDIFLGYSYLDPKGTVNGFTYNAVNYGVAASVTRYFTRHAGLQFEGDEHILLPEDGFDSSSQPNDDFSGGSGGVILRFPHAGVTPFIHALVGAEQVGSYPQPATWGPVITAGGGVDIDTPLFDRHLAIRLFQADYQYTREDFPVGRGGTADFNILRLSAGVVWHAGTIVPPPPAQLSCSANPVTVFPGDPVTITATAGNLDPKLNAVYSWTGNGVSGAGTSVSVATGSLPPASYTVTGTVKEGKNGKEGLKPWETANCSAVFTVKAFEPPTIACSPSPSIIGPGQTSNITSVGMSPQNRPLTYSYSASAGAISGSDASATFSSAGAPTGAVGITCNVSDDKGQTATASTTVTITAPYVPAAPHTQALCSISFSKDLKRPTRVDNEAKACLDEFALDLQQQSDAKAVVVGESDAKEKARSAEEQAAEAKRKHPKSVIDDAAQRAVNAKDYLVTEKGIDASRISVATGTTDGQTVEDYLVPAGATYATDVQGTTPVDETAVKAQTRKPLGARHGAKPANPSAQ